MAKTGEGEARGPARTHKTIRMGIAHAHGLRGEVKVVLDHEGSSLDWRGLEVTLRPRGPGTAKRLRVESARRAPRLAFLHLEGVRDRTAAEAMEGWEVAVDRASLPEPGDGEVYLEDLVGLRVRERPRGAPSEVVPDVEIGVVQAISVYPAASCAVVVLDAGGEVEVPVVEPYVVEVDLQNGVLLVAHLTDLGGERAAEPSARDDGAAR